MYKCIVGAQVSSVKPYLTTEADVLESFKKFAKSGYKYVQVQWVDYSVDMNFVRKALDEAGLIAVSVQEYFHLVDERRDDFVKMCKTWGCGDLTVSGIPEDYMTYEGCVKFGKYLEDFAKDVEKEGLTLSFHPRAQEYRLIGDSTALDIMMTNAPSLKMCLDAFHVVVSGLKPADMIAKYADRMTFIHFKEYKSAVDVKKLSPIGQGAIDWTETFKACVDYKVPYAFTEQESWGKDPFECMEESLNYVLSSGLFKTE